MTVALSVRDLSHSYGGVAALRGVTFEAMAGEWLGLAGPNGAGKTTLLHRIAGLAPCDAGEVEILGRRRGPAVTARDVGFVPQGSALYVALTVRENLEIFGRLHGLAVDILRPRVEWALGWTGLADRAHECVAVLSGGMARRLHVACAVLHRPRVVLLDEPTAGVDAHGRAELRRMLRRLCDDGAALVESSHELRDIERSCDRLLVMHRGEVLACGTLVELVERTVGESSAFRMTLAGRPTDGARTDTITGTLADVRRDLPGLLRDAGRSGRALRSLSIEPPGLEEVFAHLTGEARR